MTSSVPLLSTWIHVEYFVTVIGVAVDMNNILMVKKAR